MMPVRFASATHVGKVRKVNEDSILSLPDDGVWAVSDGMGGHSAGDFASQTVVDRITMMPAGLSPRETLDAMRDALREANAIIRDKAKETGGGTIGATVVTLILVEGHFASFWMGDSRLYLLRDGDISLLTTDHSVVGEMVADGQMTWDEAEKHPLSNQITRAVGVEDEVEIDKVRGEVQSGDRFLLCSDGLTKYASFDLLRDVLAHTRIEVIADTLIRIALDGGGADNVSVIVVDVP